MGNELNDKENTIETLSLEVNRLKEREEKLKNDVDKNRKLLTSEKEKNTKAQLNDEVQRQMESYLTQITLLQTEDEQKNVLIQERNQEILTLNQLIEKLDPKGKKRKKFTK